MYEPEVAINERLYPAPEHTPDQDTIAIRTGRGNVSNE
jgi:hypothetical protein